MSTVKSKRCSKCKENKPLTDFHKDRTKKDGLRIVCKSCMRKYRQENREAINERRRKYRQENREAVNERRRNYYQKNKEARKEWYQENKEAIKEYGKKYREANKEAIKERTRKYRQENKEHYNNYKKERYATDPEYRTSCQLRDQTRRLGDFKNTTTIELVGCSPAEFWEMNGSPTIEELQDLHIDHIIPLSWFDLSNEDHVKVCNHYLNLQYLNSKDNIAKKDTYMGSPDNILAYKDDFDIDAHVSEMLVIIKSLN